MLLCTVFASHPVLLHTSFTWLHNAGAKNSLIYLTALFTPTRRNRNERLERKEEVNTDLMYVLKCPQRLRMNGSNQTDNGGNRWELSYPCPCSVFCHCHGAPEPRRCPWKHRWELQLWKDLKEAQDNSMRWVMFKKHWLQLSQDKQHNIYTEHFRWGIRCTRGFTLSNRE